MSTTWLTVPLEVERYIVLYYRLKAKWLLSLKRTKVILVIIYLISALLALPYSLNKHVTQCVGLDGIGRHQITLCWKEGFDCLIFYGPIFLHCIG